MLKYGYRNFGLSFSTLQSIDKMAFDALAVPGFKPCYVTSLFIHLQQLPSSDLIKGQLEWWVRFWVQSPSKEVFQTWRKEYSRLANLEPVSRWASNSGPIGVTITILLALDVVPACPNTWQIEGVNVFVG